MHCLQTVCWGHSCAGKAQTPSGTNRCRQAQKVCLIWQWSHTGCAGVPDGYWPCRDWVRGSWDLPVTKEPSISKHRGASKLSLILSTVACAHGSPTLCCDMQGSWSPYDLWSPSGLRWQLSFCSIIINPVWTRASLLEILSGLCHVQGWRFHCILHCC